LGNHLEEISLGALPLLVESGVVPAASNFDASEEQSLPFSGAKAVENSPGAPNKGKDRADDASAQDAKVTDTAAPDHALGYRETSQASVDLTDINITEINRML
jgi:hypothetical protein